MAVIYVVEDDTNIQEIEAIALKNSGHKVYTFDDAAHFYKKIKDFPITSKICTQFY